MCNEPACHTRRRRQIGRASPGRGHCATRTDHCVREKSIVAVAMRFDGVTHRLTIQKSSSRWDLKMSSRMKKTHKSAELPISAAAGRRGIGDTDVSSESASGWRTLRSNLTPAEFPLVPDVPDWAVRFPRPTGVTSRKSPLRLRPPATIRRVTTPSCPSRVSASEQRNHVF